MKTSLRKSWELPRKLSPSKPLKWSVKFNPKFIATEIDSQSLRQKKIWLQLNRFFGKTTYHGGIFGVVHQWMTEATDRSSWWEARKEDKNLRLTLLQVVTTKVSTWNWTEEHILCHRASQQNTSHTLLLLQLCLLDATSPIRFTTSTKKLSTRKLAK